MNYLLLVPISLLPNNIGLIKECKSVFSSILLHNFYYIMKMNMNLSLDKSIKDINKNPEKIDIIMCNHISIFDCLLLIVSLKELGIDYYNFTFRKGLNKELGLFMVHCDTDILVDRSWDTDKNNIDKQLDKIKILPKKQVIVIYPEGNRINYERLLASQKYSKDKDLPIYNNLLTPRVKGIWHMINKLKEKNILGNVWDVSLIRPNYISDPNNKLSNTKDILSKTSNWSDMINKKFDDYYVIINKVNYINNYNNYNEFKSWFYDYWKNKDNMILNYKNYSYYKLNENNEYSFKNIKYDYLIMLLVFLTSLYLLTRKEGRKVFVLLIFLSYIIIFLKNKNKK